MYIRDALAPPGEKKPAEKRPIKGRGRPRSAVRPSGTSPAVFVFIAVFLGIQAWVMVSLFRMPRETEPPHAVGEEAPEEELIDPEETSRQMRPLPAEAPSSS